MRGSRWKKFAAGCLFIGQIALLGLTVRYNFGVSPWQFDMEGVAADSFVLQMIFAETSKLPQENLRQNDLAFGRALYRHYKNIAESAEVCGRRHLRDCNAGVLIEFVKNRKIDKLNDERLLEIIERTFCKGNNDAVHAASTQLEKCYSNLGQSLIELTGGEIERALKYCGQLQAQELAARSSCAFGAYRRWIKTNELRMAKFADSYEEDCSNTLEHRAACLRAAGSAVFFQYWSTGKINADEICRNGTVEDQNQCFEGIAGEFLLRNSASEKIREFCASLTNEARKLKCRELLGF